MLYFRMLITTAVSLFTVRIILNALGVEDYGIFNLVGGIVTSFSFLSSTMASATQRFFAFELGSKNYIRLNNIFNLTIVIYVGIAIIIFFLAQVLGVWFLNEKLSIPIERMDAANWVYQFSILAFMVTILSIPFEAIIMAREEMSFYAYISIVESILRVAVVYLLLLFDFDKLRLYAVLTFLVTVFLKLVYYFYCRRKFKETRFSFFWNKALFSELLSYAGWNLFGALTNVSFNQGVNFLLNIFFGPVVNASRGIANQINNAVASFSTNFYSAVRPQIIKSYASNNEKQMMDLVFKSTKYSFFLLMLLSMPILLSTDYILKFWLTVVPDHTETFVQLTIWYNLVNLLQIPISTAVHATGRIKIYQFVIGMIMLLCLPLSYIALNLNYPPEVVFYMMIIVSLIALLFRLIILKKLVSFAIKDYIMSVLLRITTVILLSYGICYFIVEFLVNNFFVSDIVNFLFTCVVSILVSLGFTYYTGLSKSEKIFITGILFKIKTQYFRI